MRINWTSSNYENKCMMNTTIAVSKYNVPVESVKRVMRCVDNELSGSLCSECGMSLKT